MNVPSLTVASLFTPKSTPQTGLLFGFGLGTSTSHCTETYHLPALWLTVADKMFTPETGKYFASFNFSLRIPVKKSTESG